MNIYLLKTKDGRHVFYAREEAAETDAPEAPGLRGRVERKFRNLKEIWQTSDRWVIARTRHLWEALQRRMHPDEGMLTRLRKEPGVTILHPASLSSEEARTVWEGYLAGRLFRHLPWLGVNGLIAPLSIVLAPLPGPNLVGYWFAYRAVRDLLVLLGVRRARRGEFGVTFRPVLDLDLPLVGTRLDPRISIALGGDAEGLSDYLERSGMKSVDAPTL